MKKEYSEKLVEVLGKVELSEEELGAFQEIVLVADEEDLKSIVELVEKDEAWVKKLAVNLLEKRQAVQSGDANAVEAILKKEQQDIEALGA